MSQPEARDSDVGQAVAELLADRYEITGRLGSGGVGIVYRGVLREMNLPVAIKVLRPELAANKEIFARFQREAASASSIGNPHIVRMVELASLPNGAAYIAMEYLEGESLAERLARGPMSADEAVAIVMQIIDGLGACHERDVVHRDLKPDNVLLTAHNGRPGFVKIVDFGMARLVGSSTKLTNQGAIIGTPHYMSPEQCKGQPADHRADVYGVGILLYRMVTGKLPFDGDKWLQVLSQQVHADPVPPSQHLPKHALAPGLEDVILKAMQKQPEARFQSMREMGKALADAAQHAVLHEAEPTGAFPNEAVDAPRRSRPATGWMLASIAIGTLAVLTAFAVSRHWLHW